MNKKNHPSIKRHYVILWFLFCFLKACVPSDVNQPLPTNGPYPQWGKRDSIGKDTPSKSSMMMPNIQSGNTSTENVLIGDSVNGKALFLKYCATCHGVAAEGGQRMGLQVPALITSPLLQKDNAWKEIHQVVSVGRGAMPAFNKSLVEKDIQDVVSYVASLKK